MRTSIAHSERFAVIRPPQHQRNFQQHRLRQVPAPYFRTARRRIPKIPQESRRVALRFLCTFAFRRMLLKLYSCHSSRIVVHLCFASNARVREVRAPARRSLPFEHLAKHLFERFSHQLCHLSRDRRGRRKSRRFDAHQVNCSPHSLVACNHKIGRALRSRCHQFRPQA